MTPECPSHSSPFCSFPTGRTPTRLRAPRGGLEDDPRLLWLRPAQPAAGPPPGKPAAACQRRGVWEAEWGGAAHQQARRAPGPLPLCGWGELGGWLAHKPSRAGCPSMFKVKAAPRSKNGVCGLDTCLLWIITRWRHITVGPCQLSWTCIQGVVLGLVVLPETLLQPAQCGSSPVLVTRLCQGVTVCCNSCLGARSVNIQKYISIFFHLWGDEMPAEWGKVLVCSSGPVNVT